jgi:hypothetical protein
MPLTLAATRRYARQLALPEIGSAGQERLGAATFALVGRRGDAAGIEAAALYLAGAGVGGLRLVGAELAGIGAAIAGVNGTTAVDVHSWPADGDGWVAALRGAAVALRGGLDDDPMLRAAVRIGLPVVAMRARESGVELLSFRRQGPCPHVSLAVPAAPSTRDVDVGAVAVVGGTLAAAEALWVVAGEPAPEPRALLLKVDLAGGDATRQEIPWRPECFLCGGAATEVVPP